MAQPKFVILDTETTGLDEKKNIILEVGIVLYSAQLEEIAAFRSIAADDIVMDHVNYHMQDGVDNFIKDMHIKNGLFDEIQNWRNAGHKNSHAKVEQDAIDWLATYDLGDKHIKLPLTGNSIGFDRRFMMAQMPRLNDSFHYRNIDVSTIKEMCRVYRPDVLSNAEKPKKDAVHRVIDDCRATRDELAYYVEHLFLVGEHA